MLLWLKNLHPPDRLASLLTLIHSSFFCEDSTRTISFLAKHMLSYCNQFLRNSCTLYYSERSPARVFVRHSEVLTELSGWSESWTKQRKAHSQKSHFSFLSFYYYSKVSTKHYVHLLQSCDWCQESFPTLPSISAQTRMLWAFLFVSRTGRCHCPLHSEKLTRRVILAHRWQK